MGYLSLGTNLSPRHRILKQSTRAGDVAQCPCSPLTHIALASTPSTTKQHNEIIRQNPLPTGCPALCFLEAAVCLVTSGCDTVSACVARAASSSVTVLKVAHGVSQE